MILRCLGEPESLAAAVRQLGPGAGNFILLRGAVTQRRSDGPDFIASQSLAIETGLESFFLSYGLDEERSLQVSRLIGDFARGFDVRGVNVRFSRVRHQQCRLFHADYLTARLFCTLEGRGTEYIRDADVDRTYLGKGCNERVVRNPARVIRASAGDVLIMAGEKLCPGGGLVHRSPPIKAGQSRLYVSCDI